MSETEESKRTATLEACRIATQNERLANCDIVIGYDVANGDTFVIKDKHGITGRVLYEHALDRLALARMRSKVLFEQREQEGLDEECE